MQDTLTPVRQPAPPVIVRLPALHVGWLRFDFSNVDKAPAPCVNEWRGAFGQELRRGECLTGAPQCAGCPARADCRYGRLFDTAPASGGTWMQGIDHVPHPMLLRAASAEAGTSQGEGAALEVLLFGRPAIAEAARVAGALARAAMRGVGRARGRWRLRSVASRADAQGPWRALDLNDVDAWRIDAVALQPPACPAGAAIRFVSPVRIQRGGRPIGPQALTFADFYASLLRRISSIAHFHESHAWQADFRGLVEQARTVRFAQQRLQWHDDQRYSFRQRTSVPLGGIVGSARIEGDLRPFWPHLWAGQWVHVGKATIFGHGRFALEAPATGGKLAAAAPDAGLPQS